MGGARGASTLANRSAHWHPVGETSSVAEVWWWWCGGVRSPSPSFLPRARLSFIAVTRKRAIERAASLRGELTEVGVGKLQDAGPREGGGGGIDGRVWRHIGVDPPPRARPLLYPATPRIPVLAHPLAGQGFVRKGRRCTRAQTEVCHALARYCDVGTPATSPAIGLGPYLFRVSGTGIFERIYGNC